MALSERHRQMILRDIERQQQVVMRREYSDWPGHPPRDTMPYLRQRYAEGHIDIKQFEERVEAVLRRGD